MITTSKLLVLRRPVEAAQYNSIKNTERLAQAGIEPSVGSVGNIPPSEAEQRYYAMLDDVPMAA